ncbi:MAG: hypothetical protein KBA81_03580 [Rhabdochlamydiaceae bacterium]|nr:hypothetical protein [Rhabdochlamydiaceae bacterium]
MPYVSPAAMKEATVSVKPISQKKEFEQLIRSIRTIAANTRAFSGDMIKQLNDQTESSAKWQKWISGIGSVLQIGAAAGLAPVLLKMEKIKPEEFMQWLQNGSKIGDGIQGIFGLSQLSHQAESQRNQQALSHYNSFDQRMQSIIQSIDSAQQRLQQKEMEDASNR